MVLRIAILASCSLIGVKGDLRADLVRYRAEEIGKALISGAYGKVVDLTSPKVVQMVGGRDKMIDLLVTGVQKMKAQGTSFSSVVVGTPSEFKTGGPDLFVVVPNSIEMKVRGGKLIQKSFVVGISADEGRTWFFVDGNLGAEKIKIVFPNFSSTLELPSIQSPVFEPTP